jgi:serine protease Do
MSHKLLRDAVFKINTGSGSGTGFYLQKEGVIVTNFHVIEGNHRVSIEDQQKNRYLAHVVFGNPETDIAFLRADKLSFNGAVAFNEIKNVENRDKVWVIGYPFGLPYTETEGIVSNSKQLMDGRHFIQIDAAVNPGNSGGPVVDVEGNLLGVTTAKFNNADNMGFAIPTNVVQEELETLKSNPDLKYAIKCNSCKNLVFQKTDYCPNCGANIDEHLFEEKPLDEFAQFVESALSSLNMNAILARTGYDYWEFYQGSSQIRIFVFNRNYLYATSPLNNLPQQKLEEIYSFILSNPVSPYKLGVYNNQIFLSYRFHISDIYTDKKADIQDKLTHLALKADELDDYFVKEYGAELTNFSKT